MKLYLVRHTTPSDTAASDFVRTLTLVGEEEARIVGSALAKLGARPAHVLTSPLVRARQTTEIVARTLGFEREVESIDELKNGSSTQSLLRLLNSYGEANEIILVGHMPSLAEHISAMTRSNSSEKFPLGKGSVACVEMDLPDVGGGRLTSLLHLAELRRLAV
jgi:phosphohistidine phosphatase